jgi:hypothetical protein
MYGHVCLLVHVGPPEDRTQRVGLIFEYDIEADVEEDVEEDVEDIEEDMSKISKKICRVCRRKMSLGVDSNIRQCQLDKPTYVVI